MAGHLIQVLSGGEGEGVGSPCPRGDGVASACPGPVRGGGKGDRLHPSSFFPRNGWVGNVLSRREWVGSCGQSPVQGGGAGGSNLELHDPVPALPWSGRPWSVLPRNVNGRLPCINLQIIWRRCGIEFWTEVIFNIRSLALICSAKNNLTSLSRSPAGLLRTVQVYFACRKCCQTSVRVGIMELQFR